MPIIDFDGVAEPVSVAPLPRDYAGFKWKHGHAAHVDTEIMGVVAILESGDSTGFFGDRKAVMKSRSGDFSLIDGLFAAAHLGTVELRVKGLDDGVAVARERMTLDQSGSFEHFKSAFSSIDKLRFSFHADNIAVEDLDVRFDVAPVVQDWMLG